jgi:hypothetical protein
VPAARYAWTADVARTGDASETTPDPPANPIDALLGVVCRAPATRGVASTALLRAARSPLQFVFVAPPLLAAIPLVESALTTGTLPGYAPWFVVWYGAWVAGAVVPLNPLGIQGAALPSLLTAPAEGRHVVHGHVVAAALPAAPLTAGLAVAAGVLAGSSGATLAALAPVSVVAVAVAATLAAGIGSVFPRFEGVDLGSARSAVPPSKLAYTLFSTLLTVLVVAAAVVADPAVRALLAALFSAWLPFGVDVGADALVVAGWGLLAGGVALVPLAYRTAVCRVAAYRLE